MVGTDRALTASGKGYSDEVKVWCSTKTVPEAVYRDEKRAGIEELLDARYMPGLWGQDSGYTIRAGRESQAASMTQFRGIDHTRCPDSPGKVSHGAAKKGLIRKERTSLGDPPQTHTAL